MIYSLKGTLIHAEPNALVIECSGVGYKCNVTTSTATANNGVYGTCTVTVSEEQSEEGTYGQ